MTSAPIEDGRPAPVQHGLRAFISYRRSDAQSAGRQLADALKLRFGAENVFFDTKDLALGTTWQREITQRVGDADVVLAVIGPRWVAIADERGKRRVLDPGEEDVLRIEIETALRSGSVVVPVLVDDAQMPARESLPRPFRPIAGLEATSLRHSSWDEDVKALSARLEQRVAQARHGAQAPAQAPPPLLTQVPSEPGPAVSAGSTWAAPGDEHYADVARYLRNGSIVFVLGSGVNTVDRDGPFVDGGGSLPDAHELALALAHRFDLPADGADLARVSQHIYMTSGEPDLHKALRQLLIRTSAEPGPVHGFLARLPGLLRRCGQEGYQLLVTTNYDTALERAFDALHEPFDLAVFMATGEHAGKFLHIPWWDGAGDAPEPGPMWPANRYTKLPIDEDGELSRTVIVKIHGGALHDAPADFQVKHNFVVTEDDYIGYLARSPIEGLVPVQFLEKLKESHFLFLGYEVREWSLRVFLRRIWSEQKPNATSWAIQPTLDKVDRGFWEKLDVERFDFPLARYASEFERRLAP